MRIEAYLGLICFSVGWLVSLLGTLALYRHFKRSKPDLRSDSEFPAISILKPLKGCDEGLKENLRSFFCLDYSKYEILFSVSAASDPALEIVRELQAEYPNVPTKTFVGGSLNGENPKVNNLVLSYDAARFDHLLISDSNVRVRTDYLRLLAPELLDDVGIVTAVVAGCAALTPAGVLEAGYLNTFYARWMFIAKFFGCPPVVGKSMFFKKSVMERLGGLRTLGTYIAEDYMAGYGVRQLGMKVAFLRSPVRQYLGDYSFRAFFERHVRWGRIRKSMAPFAFLGEIVFLPFVSALLGTIGFCVAGWEMLAAASICFGLWWALDIWSLYLMDELTLESAMAFWVREGVIPVIWATVISGRTVKWRGRAFRLEFGGTLQEATR